MGSPEAWNPRTFEEGGLGGSETAVIKLGEAFSRQLGNRVHVYSQIKEPGYYNGVRYYDQTQFRPEEPSDLYIAWRNPEAADWGINTKKLVLWMHDTDAGDRLTPERARRFDAIVVLTRWHQKFMLDKYPFLRPEQFVVIGNGVDLDRFEKGVQREPHRVIYSSSPDRGLDVILEGIWPKVVEAIPDAELHVYYGWKNFDIFAPHYPELAAFRDKVEKLILNSKGVVHHGRVNQKELARAFQQSSVWLYPTYFTETYCITAVEAQLAGAIPVTSHLAALKETVTSGIIIDGDVHDPGVQQEYAEAVIQTLLTPMKHRSSIHQKVRRNAPASGWDWVAGVWRSHFLQGGNDAGHSNSPSIVRIQNSDTRGSDPAVLSSI
jgi:glycosyltransferase involved in cell wall biosynthesis